MFESAELGNELAKAEYREQVGPLRAALVEMQRQLAAAHFSVVLVFSGLPTAGKSETVNKLLEWLDARGIETHAQRDPTDEERQRPPMWRFCAPCRRPARSASSSAAGTAGRSCAACWARATSSELDHDLEMYVGFERMLMSENVLLVKVWLHLPEKALRKRIRKLRRDPATAWKVTGMDSKLADRYDRFLDHAEHLITRTGGSSPWHIVEATDERYRELTVGRIVLDGDRRAAGAREGAASRTSRSRWRWCRRSGT